MHPGSVKRVCAQMSLTCKFVQGWKKFAHAKAARLFGLRPIERDTGESGHKQPLARVACRKSSSPLSSGPSLPARKRRKPGPHEIGRAAPFNEDFTVLICPDLHHVSLSAVATERHSDRGGAGQQWVIGRDGLAVLPAGVFCVHGYGFENQVEQLSEAAVASSASRATESSKARIARA